VTGLLILTCTVLKGYSTGAVCFSFFFWLRVLDKAEYSPFESTLNSSIVSYRKIHEIRFRTGLRRSHLFHSSP